LRGMRMVIAIETGEDMTLDEVLVKELTGCDLIRARRMHQDFFEFAPTHTMGLCTNHKPEIKGTDHAIWRRLRLVPFDVTIPEAQRDKAMPSKLAEQAQGILADLVKACLEWQKDGLNPPASVTLATAKYRTEQDLVAQFVSECCVVAPDKKVGQYRATALYEAFQKWCKASGLASVLTQKKFGDGMNQNGFERFTNNGTYYRGIGLRQDDGDPSGAYG
jgi:putative DNA primase/helicase